MHCAPFDMTARHVDMPMPSVRTSAPHARLHLWERTPARGCPKPFGRRGGLPHLLAHSGAFPCGSAPLRANASLRGAATHTSSRRCTGMGIIAPVKLARPPLVHQPKGRTGGTSGLHRTAQEVTPLHREVRIRATETSRLSAGETGNLCAQQYQVGQPPACGSPCDRILWSAGKVDG